MVNKFRIFICYAHEDSKLASRVAAVLDAMGHLPVWDQHIRPGTPFTDAIKSMITHAHVFMPIITAKSQSRPWVHQETGYALALDIPVLPLAVGRVPAEMIAQLQALKVRADLSDLKAQLGEVNLDCLVLPPPPPPKAIVEVAESPEDRTRMMADHARRVVEMGSLANAAGSHGRGVGRAKASVRRLPVYGRLRQWGALSSFCIPDADLGDEVWNRREGKLRRSTYYRELQRGERQALEAHARGAGCDLLIDPKITYDTNGSGARVARLETLKAALEDLIAAGADVRVFTCHLCERRNLTIVGDWFVAESLVPLPGRGYRQTIFNWHAPTVLQQVHRFDQHLEYLASQAGQPGSEVLGPQPEKVVSYLDQLIRRLEEDLEKCGPTGATKDKT